MGFVRPVLWTALFLASTFAFTVFFEHGFSLFNFPQNAKKEWSTLQKLYWSKIERSRQETLRIGR
jgi:hypothetical protein